MITRREELWRHVELVVSGAPHRVHPEVLVTLVQELHRRNQAGVRCVGRSVVHGKWSVCACLVLLGTVAVSQACTICDSSQSCCRACSLRRQQDGGAFERPCYLRWIRRPACSRAMDIRRALGVLGPTQHHALTCLCMRFVAHLRDCVTVTLHCSRDDWLDAATSSTLKWLRPFASM